MRTAALAGVAKKLYDESRKPENRARIKAAAAEVRDRRTGADLLLAVLGSRPSALPREVRGRA